MRLYLLELTPLEYLSDLSTPPTNGDIVAYMRAGQDPSGVHSRALERQGIRVISTETFLSMEDARAIHQMGEKFINGWYLNSDGTDTSLYQGVSIGELVAAEIIFQTCPAMFCVRCHQVIRSEEDYSRCKRRECDEIGAGDWDENCDADFY